jgi:hypothetical protein
MVSMPLGVKFYGNTFYEFTANTHIKMEKIKNTVIYVVRPTSGYVHQAGIDAILLFNIGDVTII